MKAIVEQEGDVFVVRLSGFLDYESLDPFRLSCLQYFSSKKVIFNLKNLSFVGSSGITPFVETMTELKGLNRDGFKFCEVGSEFRRVFAASPVSDIEIYDSEQSARLAFTRPDLMVPQVPQTFLEAEEDEGNSSDVPTHT